jgi:hypothetical protein
VVLDAVKNNRRVAQALIGAYRTGSCKLVGRSLHGRFGDRGKQAAELLIKGIDNASNGIEAAIRGFSSQMSKAVSQVDGWIGRVENPYASRYLQYVGALNLPGARLVRAVSGRLASGADRIYGGADSRRTEARAESVRRRRRTRRRA